MTAQRDPDEPSDEMSDEELEAFLNPPDDDEPPAGVDPERHALARELARAEAALEHSTALRSDLVATRAAFERELDGLIASQGAAAADVAAAAQSVESAQGHLNGLGNRLFARQSALELRIRAARRQLAETANPAIADTREATDAVLDWVEVMLHRDRYRPDFPQLVQQLQVGRSATGAALDELEVSAISTVAVQARLVDVEVRADSVVASICSVIAPNVNLEPYSVKAMKGVPE